LTGAVILGIVVSTIVTVWLVVLVFPLASVAVHVIMVSPRGNVAGALLVMIGFGSALSEAVALP